MPQGAAPAHPLRDGARIIYELLARALPGMARPEGLEPPTLGLEGRCSIRLSYGRDLKKARKYTASALTPCGGETDVPRQRSSPRAGSGRLSRAGGGVDVLAARNGGDVLHQASARVVVQGDGVDCCPVLGSGGLV